MSEKSSPLKSQFQIIQQKRLKQLQEKLNITCCQYDSLMPLLDIVDFIPHIYQHEKQFKNLQKKIHAYGDQLKQTNNQKQDNLYNSDSNHFLVQIKNTQINLDKVKKQLFEFDLFSKQSKNFETKLNQIDINQYIQSNQKYLQKILAQYKNQMDINLKKYQNSQNLQLGLQKNIKKVIKEQKINNFDYLIKIDNQIQVAKGMLVTQDLIKFHQFNYHRLEYEIVTLSQSVCLLQEKYNNGGCLDQEDQAQLNNIKESIQKYKWQMIGSKKYYLRQISKLYFIEKSNFQTNGIQNKISQEFQQVQQIFKQLVINFNQLVSKLQ